MSEFKSVQEGRHTVRDLLSKAYKAGKSVDVDEKLEVNALTKEARGLLKGVVGLSQEQQVERLEKVGALIQSALDIATAPVVVEALTEAAAALTEATEANESVKSLAAERDFEAWQAEKAEKKAAAYESESDEESDEDYDEVDFDAYDDEEDED